MNRNPALFLIGPRGAGKTTLGRLMAGHLGWPFTDADRLLEERTGRRIEDWLPADPAGFRAAESALLRELVGRFEEVVALGGGVVEDPANVELLAAQPRVIALTAAPSVLVRRQEREPRPALTESSLAEEVRLLLDRRREAYDRAAHGLWVDTSGHLDEAFQFLLQTAGRLGCLNC
ncbi:MAG: shikimate kinase [Planctomycetota bacterium]|nr:MAG: shikimate kinase [Planctomycetota bacterium]